MVLASFFSIAVLALSPGEEAPDAMELLADGGLPPLTDDGGLPRSEPEPIDADAGIATEEAPIDVAEESAEHVDAELGEEPQTPPAMPTVDAGVDLGALLRPPFLAARVRIAASQALVGRFASNTCQRPVAVSVFERVSARLEGARAAIGTAPIVFDAGDMLGNSALGRLAVEADVARLAEAVAAMGIRGRAVGHRDLAGSRQQLMDFTRALNARNVPTVLSNVICGDSSKDLCAGVISRDSPPLIIDTPEGRVAFIAAISPTSLRQIDKTLGQGIQLTPAAEAIADATRRARAMGATWVVAAYDPAIGSELEDATQMVASIDSAASPDVVFVSGVAEQFRSALTADGNTMLVATRPAEVVTVELRDARAHAIDVPAPATASPEVTAFAKDLNDALCARYAGSLPGSHLERELDRETAGAFVLDVLREHASAEIALINKRSISSNAPWPMRAALSPLDLLQMLPFDNRMRTMVLPGSRLVAFLGSRSAQDYFVRGAANADGWRINNRPVDLNQNYRIVTTDFVVDKLISDFGLPTPATEEVAGGNVREEVTRWLTVPRVGDILLQPADPAKRTRWTVSYRLQLDVTNVSISNPDTALFTETQLARGHSRSVAGETEVRAIGDHPSYSLESQLRLRYGWLESVTLDGTPNRGENNVDISTFRTLANARRVFGPPVWYLPQPYGDLYVETELTRPVTRPYHHLQLLPQAGVRFELWPTFALYVGGGLTWEVFARAEELTPKAPPAAVVVVGGWQLRPTKLLQLGSRWLELESNLDIFARDLDGPTQVQARGRARLLFPLFSVFSFIATYDLFLRYAAGQVGVSHDLYVGLQIAIGRSVQAFAF